MPLTPVWEPDAEALDRTLKLRVSTRQLEQLELRWPSSTWPARGFFASALRSASLCSSSRCVSGAARGWFRAGSTRIRMRPVRGVALVRMAGVPIGGSVLRFDAVEEAVGRCRIRPDQVAGTERRTSLCRTGY